MIPKLDRKTQKLMDRGRTVTAAALPGKKASCANCGKSCPADLEPDKLWGIDAKGITTGTLDLVDHWCCEPCFAKDRHG